MSMIQIRRTNSDFLDTNDIPKYRSQIREAYHEPAPRYYIPSNPLKAINTSANLWVVPPYEESRDLSLDRENYISMVPDASIYGSPRVYLVNEKFQNQLRSKILELAKLPKNWDGNNAIKISSNTTKFTLSILDEIRIGSLNRIGFVNKLEIFPTINGGYQFEIRVGFRELEIEYLPSEKIFEILFIQIIGDQEIYLEEQIRKTNRRGLIDKINNWLITENV